MKYNLCAEYTGFVIPNVLVFGYGMDYNEEFREMPHLCVINDKGIKAYQDARQNI